MGYKLNGGEKPSKVLSFISPQDLLLTRDTTTLVNNSNLAASLFFSTLLQNLIYFGSYGHWHSYFPLFQQAALTYHPYEIIFLEFEAKQC